jgi:hypothetical protein
MRSASDLAAWLAQLARPGADPRRGAALNGGYDLERLAIDDGEIDRSEQGRGEFAQWMAQLRADGWLAWRFELWPGDRDEPAAFAFRPDHLQRVRQVRLTPEGWRAIPGLLTPGPVADGRLEPPDADGSEDAEGERDVFISHASEDRDAVARPLAIELRKRGWTVWFDEFELSLGDGLRRTIDRGLGLSKFGVVVLSPAFFSKEWPQRELDGLVARESQSGDKVVLPVWHGVDAEYVTRFSPTLGDKLAASSRVGAPVLAEEIERVLIKGQRPRQANAAPQPSPGSAISAVTTNPALDAIMAQNEPVLREVLRRESAAYAAVLEAAIEGKESQQPTADIAHELGTRLLPVVERYTTQLLPLVEHSPKLLERELRSLSRRLQRPGVSGFVFWADVPRWAVWWLTHVVGAYAVRREAFDAVRALLESRFSDSLNQSLPLTYNFLGDATAKIGEALAPPPPRGQRWNLPAWEFLAHSVSSSAPLRDGWPELFEFQIDPKLALGEWSFIQGLGLGLKGDGTVGYWSVVPGVRDFARRLRGDRALRASFAEQALGVSLDELDARAEEALSGSRAVGTFADRDAADIFVGRSE